MKRKILIHRNKFKTDVSVDIVHTLKAGVGYFVLTYLGIMAIMTEGKIPVSELKILVSGNDMPDSSENITLVQELTPRDRQKGLVMLK